METNKEEIKQTIAELESAILENLDAKQEVYEAELKQKQTHFKKQEALERLLALERNL
jgi:hypothetical protein